MIYVLVVSAAILGSGLTLAIGWLWLLRHHCSPKYALRLSSLYFGAPLIFLFVVNTAMPIDDGGIIFSVLFVVAVETWKLVVARRLKSEIESLSVLGLFGPWEIVFKSLAPWLHPILFSQVIFSDIYYILAIIVVAVLMHMISAIIYSYLGHRAPVAALFIGVMIASIFIYVSRNYIFGDNQASISHGAVLITGFASVVLLATLWRWIAVRMLRAARSMQDEMVFR